eukprot:2528587-Rhodomonas_salina.1
MQQQRAGGFSFLGIEQDCCPMDVCAGRLACEQVGRLADTPVLMLLPGRRNSPRCYFILARFRPRNTTRMETRTALGAWRGGGGGSEGEQDDGDDSRGGGGGRERGGRAEELWGVHGGGHAVCRGRDAGGWGGCAKEQ